MTTNGKNLKLVETYLTKFDIDHDSEVLGAAQMALEDVHWRTEHDPRTGAEVRGKCLSAWLRLLAILDTFLDPAFDKNEVPDWNVVPPPHAGAGGVDLMPNADPALVADPVVRTRYADARAAAMERYARYRFQLNIHRLNERLPPLATMVEGFIRSSYSPGADDQAELRTVIDQIITNPARKAALSKLLSPPSP